MAKTETVPDMTDDTTPVDEPPADAPTEDMPADTPDDDDTEAYTEPVDIPAIGGVPDPHDSTLRAAVEDAGQDLQPGQTITTTTAGEAIVVGSPKADLDADPDLTIGDHGDTVAVDTPLGRVIVGLEHDATTTTDLVTVTVVPLTPDFGVVSDAILMRYRR